MSTSSQGALVPPIPSVPRYNPRSFQVAQLLQVNKTPSPQELSELRRTVAEALQNIIDLGQRIEATRELLDDLISQQSYASDALDDARFITHSPHRLPEDVLSEIFYHCINEVVEALRVGQTRCVLHRDVAPLSLSQVCQRWRRVTIQAPLLWRCVSVNLHYYTMSGPENIMLALPILIATTLGAHIFSAFISKEPVRSLFMYASMVTIISPKFL
ncbi:hypothetical protein IW262DRAFT_1073189 [Armillaria fumosa]|nr:hypothetical protein IW262DRAFT_1073189 [Armillaria fumosa]